MPGFMNPAPGRGFGMGFGRGRGSWGRGGGRGRRNWFYATGLPGWSRAEMGYPAYGGGFYGGPAVPAMTKEQQIEMLKEQSEYLKEELEAVKKQMEELSAVKPAKS
jgi:hypothetical protein